MEWCGIALWIWLVAALYERCASSPSSFSKSLRLTRSIHSRVQQLLIRYKEEQIGNTLFEDRRIVLNTLPSVHINYRTWLQMKDAERLYQASRDLQLFWSHLESHRKKLHGNHDDIGEKEMKKRTRRERVHQSLSQCILGIQLDLRDLMRQVNSQVSTIKTLNEEDDYMHTSLTTPTITSSSNYIPSIASTPTSIMTFSPPDSTRSALNLILSSTLHTMVVASGTEPREGQTSLGTMQKNIQKSVSSRWVYVIEGYIILRDLERYLSRLVRDYAFLQAKSCTR